MALPKTEHFTDTDFTPLVTHDAGWTQCATTSLVDIYENGARPDTPGVLAAARWTGDTFGSDQSSQGTFKSVSSGSIIGVFVRGSGTDSTFNAYIAWRFYADGKLYVYRCNNSVTPNVAIAGPLNTIVDNDVVKIWAEGTAIHASVNGVECSGSPFTDANISGSSSSPGFMAEGYTHAHIDEWTGDNSPTGGGATSHARIIGGGVY